MRFSAWRLLSDSCPGSAGPSTTSCLRQARSSTCRCSKNDPSSLLRLWWRCRSRRSGSSTLRSFVPERNAGRSESPKPSSLFLAVFLVLEHPINRRRALLGIKQRSIFFLFPSYPLSSCQIFSFLSFLHRPAVLTTEHLNFTNPAHLEIVVRWGQQSKVHITGPISYHKPALASLMAFSGPWEISGSGETNLFWAQR